MTSPPSRRRGSGAQASLLGSIFLAPPSSLYASIDNDDHVVAGPSSSQLPFHSPHARHPHHAQDPFLLQPSDMDKSVAPSSPPTSPPRTQRHSHHGGGARSMLAQLNPNRNFGALQDDIFEEEEEDAQGGSGGGTPRGRQPSQSMLVSRTCAFDKNSELIHNFQNAAAASRRNYLSQTWQSNRHTVPHSRLPLLSLPLTPTRPDTPRLNTPAPKSKLNNWLSNRRPSSRRRKCFQWRHRCCCVRPSIPLERCQVSPGSFNSIWGWTRQEAACSVALGQRG